MKKLLIALTAASAIGIAAPAAAQSYNQNMYARGGADMSVRIDNLQARLQAGVRSGAITRVEAQQLRPPARVVDRGPYVGGREFDLTAATKSRLGFGSTGNILVDR